MLIKLTSNTSGEIIMFAKHARQLFEIIGKECTARGVFTTEQLPQAVSSLQCAVDEEKLAARLRADEERAGEGKPHSKPHDKPHDRDEDDAEQRAEMPVGLAQRARPLINLMAWTLKEKGFILWETERDF
jgi:hypothetical protein